MANLPMTPSDEIAVNRRWLWAVRVLAILPVIAVLIYAVWSFVTALRSSCAEDTRAVAVSLIFVVLPYLLSSIHLWGKALKKGLAWALLVGTFWFVITLLIAVPSNIFRDLAAELITVLAALPQGVLAASAIKTYRSMEPEEGDRGLLWRRGLLFVPYIGLLALVAVALPGLIRSRQAASQVSAVGALRTVNTAEVTYKERFRGYSPTLAALGPPTAGASVGPSAADLIDERLAGGKKSGYTFSYTPAPPDKARQISRYTVTARSTDTSCQGWQSFFTDESGIIRSTRENRPAAANDQSLGD